jgi:myo-inositol-1(or 4)-monophosphatase
LASAPVAGRPNVKACTAAALVVGLAAERKVIAASVGSKFGKSARATTLSTFENGELQRRALAATGIAVEAGKVALAAFRERGTDGALSFKGPQDYLTASDGQVEELIRGKLDQAFPGDAFFGEEGGGNLGSHVWVVDPIDGTANFARGIPHFCVAVAFVLDGVTEIGAIYNPCLDELYFAQRGRGAFYNGKRVCVSVVGDIRNATIEIGWSSRKAAGPYLELVGRVLAAGANVRRAGSGALALAYVAAGRTDGYCEIHMNAWDAIAGLLMITEAGGYANDFLAGDGLRSGNMVLGCNAALRPALARAFGG